MYVPAAGCIAPAIHRSRSGPLLAYEGMLGDQDRASGGDLQPRGASPPCCDSAFEATPSAGARPDLSWLGSVGTGLSCHQRWAGDVGTERTSRFVHRLHSCRVVESFTYVLLLLCIYVCMYVPVAGCIAPFLGS